MPQRYSPPSIEIVAFDPQDAPRVGMQWWYRTNECYFKPITDYAWRPGNLGGSNCPAVHYDLTFSGAPDGACTFVAARMCLAENLTDSYPDAAIGEAEGQIYNLVVDDGRSSC